MNRLLRILALLSTVVLSTAGCNSTDEVAVTDIDFQPYPFEEGLVIIGLQHTEPWRDGLGSLRAFPNTSIRLVYSINFRKPGSQAELDTAIAALLALPYTVDSLIHYRPSGMLDRENPGFVRVWAALHKPSLEQEAEFVSRVSSLGLGQYSPQEHLAPVVHMNVPKGQEKIIARQLRASGRYRWVELNYLVGPTRFP